MPKEDNNKIVVISFVLIALFGSFAMFSPDSPFNTPLLTASYVVASYSLSIVSFLYVSRNKHTNLEILVSISILLYWLVYFLNRYPGVAVPSNLLLLISVFTYGLTSSSQKREIFKIYRIILIITSVLGIIAYSSFFLHLGIPFTTVPYYGNNDGFLYIDYGFAYIHANIGMVSLRLCGLYNEPGFLGTFCALFLVADRVNLKHKGNFALIIAGVLTFSVAFFAILSIGITYYVIKSRRAKVVFVIVALLAVYFIPRIATTDFENEAVGHFFERFDKDNANNGMGRTGDSFDAVYKDFLEGPAVEVLFGKGTGCLVLVQDKGFASYKSYILQYGFIGAFFLWLFLLYVALLYANKNRECLVFIVCFFISIIQRPHTFTMLYYITLFGGILYTMYESTSLEYSNNKNSQEI